MSGLPPKADIGLLTLPIAMSSAATVQRSLDDEFWFLLVKTIALFKEIGESGFAPLYFTLEVIDDSPNLRNAASNFLLQVLEAYASLLFPGFHIFSKRSDPPHLRENTNAEFAGGAGGGFANVNMRSPIELQKPLSKVKIVKAYPVWFRKLGCQRRKVVSRCIEGFDIPCGFVDALFFSQPFGSAQLVIRIADLLLNCKPRNKGGNQRHCRSNDATEKTEPIRSIAFLGNIDSGRHPYGQREKGNGCSRNKRQYSDCKMGDSRSHCRNLPSLFSFVERLRVAESCVASAIE
jgi:hypothetical protein